MRDLELGQPSSELDFINVEASVGVQRNEEGEQVYPLGLQGLEELADAVFFFVSVAFDLLNGLVNEPDQLLVLDFRFLQYLLLALFFLFLLLFGARLNAGRSHWTFSQLVLL